jgi:hypothetical protein
MLRKFIKDVTKLGLLLQTHSHIKYYCLLLRRKALTLAVWKSDSNKSVARNQCIPVEKTCPSPVEFCVQVNST